MRLPRVPRVVASALRWLQFPVIEAASLAAGSRVAYGSKVVASSLGRYSYIGPGCTVVHASIGSFCSIADGCIIGGAAHPVDWVSTSPAFHVGRNILETNYSDEPFDPYQETHIGNDVWIGSHCLIRAGVRIGHGAVIGMGAVLTHDVGPYEIWAGNPARFIRARFSPEVAARLVESEWWDLSDQRLASMGPLFSNVMSFLAAVDDDSSTSE